MEKATAKELLQGLARAQDDVQADGMLDLTVRDFIEKHDTEAMDVFARLFFLKVLKKDVVDWWNGE